MTEPVKLPHNLTDAELLSFVEYYYPDAQGPLKMMISRFAMRVDGKLCVPCEYNPENEMTEDAGVLKCKHCGSRFNTETSAL